VDLRKVLQAILYILSTGCQWRALPKEFPPYSTVQGYFYTWRDTGRWQKIVAALVRRAREKLGRKPKPTAAVIDSAPTTQADGPREATMLASASTAAKADSCTAVAHLREAFGTSERRPCKAIGCCRMTVRHTTTRADDASLRQRMKAIAHERRRFGYRRLHVLLKWEGYLINHKKLFWLYREEKLAVRHRGGPKRAIGTRAPMMVPMAPNERWSLDFVSDQLTGGRRFRILTVVDDCTRECLALVADTSLSGVRVARELDG
jgi:transposase